MKKTLIIIGSILTLLIIGVWIYLFTYGTPEKGSDVFSRFGFGNNAEVPEVIVEREGTVDVSEEIGGAKERLKQLTTRPVAGASFAPQGILYVEAGTGRVYHINLETGEEKLLSGTTIPGARSALFSPDGAYVAITKIAEGGSETIVGFIDALLGNLDGFSLPPGASELSFVGTSTLMYTLRDSKGTGGYSYDIETKDGEEVFRIPLRDIHVLWGNPIYVYTTPTASQQGYLYEVRGNKLLYTVPGGRALLAEQTSLGLLTTKTVQGVVASFLTTQESTGKIPLPVIPEKCVEGLSDNLYCGIPYEINAQTFPDAWYQGINSFSDSLWMIDLFSGEPNLLSSLDKESGRFIDIKEIGVQNEGDFLYFINKNDNTLWAFDLTP